MEKIFEAFVKQMKEEEGKLLGERFIVQIKEVTKNNGVVQTGLEIAEKMSPIKTVIYLEDYFSLYIHGEPIGLLAKEIYLTCQTQKALDEVKHKAGFMQDFNLIKENIVCRLVSAKMNARRLEGLPHILVTDLAAIFYVYMGDYTDGKLFSVITRQLMEYWGASLQEILSLAMENTQRLSPVC